ncbi:MAG: ribosomal-processing cysteine protease Prp [Synergistaceae bacterium]|nr:ribosomal-processing cysteine protease Prp [Synergistaceae bacterium]
MTVITLFRREEGLVGLESRGHSGHAQRGEDVVCAAVSALVQALLLGLRDVARMEDALECEVDADVPLIRVEWPGERASEVDLLTRTVALSLREIASGYPGYVSISEVYSS